MYYKSSGTRQVEIGGRTVVVDSFLEERVIRALDARGYSGRWFKPFVGVNVGAKRYTPDLELSVQEDGMTHRAIVEIKPALSFFTPDISRRMRGIAKHYYSKILLLYADAEKSWYRIDIKTGRLDPCHLPPPGEIPISKLWRPVTMRAPRAKSHFYRRKASLTITHHALNVISDIAATVFVGPRKPKPKRK